MRGGVSERAIAMFTRPLSPGSGISKLSDWSYSAVTRTGLLIIDAMSNDLLLMVRPWCASAPRIRRP